MAVYLVTKLQDGKKNTFICDVERPSTTTSIPGEYLQIIYVNVDSLVNMNTELPVYQTNYFNGEGLRLSSFICQSSFDGVYQYYSSQGIKNFISINKTDYKWYEFR